MSENNDYDNVYKNSRLQQNQKQLPNQTFQLPNQTFKLPKLHMPQSRGRLMSRKQNKAPTYLPSIHDDTQSDRNFRNTQIIHISKSENDIIKNDQQSIRDEFALQIQQKLKMLSGSQNNNDQPQQQHHEQQNDQKFEKQSDDFDFQQKIQQNKQIIKMQRKKQLNIKKISKPLQLLEKINQNNKLKFNKPQSNYQRKMKDYNISLQNKYLQRKKESLGIIPEKPQKPVQRAKSKKIISMKDAVVDQAKLNFGYKQFKNNQIPKSQSKTNNSKPLNVANINKSHKQAPVQSQKFQKQSIKQTHKTEVLLSPSKRINKTSALFDNIQSFLQNPTAGQKHEKLYKQLYKKLKTKSIPQIEQQIKQLNQKLGVNENYETKSTVGKQQSEKQILLTQSPMERTVRDWKRIDVKDKHNIHCKQSDFQKELDYVSYLQQKNSTSLLNFIDQQKIIVELQIHRRLSKSIGKQHLATQNRQSNHIIENKQSNTAAQQSN